MLEVQGLGWVWGADRRVADKGLPRPGSREGHLHRVVASRVLIWRVRKNALQIQQRNNPIFILQKKWKPVFVYV